MAVWVFLQLAALTLAATRFPLSAHYPAAGERLAVYLLLTAQMGGSALLFPFLFGDWRGAVTLIAATFPFTAAAGLLTALPVGRITAVEFYLVLWLVMLFACRVGLPSPKWQMTVAAVAVTATIGDGLLTYLKSEFATPEPTTFPGVISAGLLVGGFQVTNGGEGSSRSWHPILVSTVMIIAVAIAASRRRKSVQSGRLSSPL